MKRNQWPLGGIPFPTTSMIHDRKSTDVFFFPEKNFGGVFGVCIDLQIGNSDGTGPEKTAWLPKASVYRIS